MRFDTSDDRWTNKIAIGVFARPVASAIEQDLCTLCFRNRLGALFSFNRLFFGSVAEEALHGSHKPYLILRHGGGAGAGASEKAEVPFESA